MSEYIVDYELIPLKWRDGYGLSDIDLTDEIVRCRDCRAMRVKYGNIGIECWMNGEPFTVEPDGFCAWAKPKVGVRK